MKRDREVCRESTTSCWHRCRDKQRCGHVCCKAVGPKRERLVVGEAKSVSSIDPLVAFETKSAGLLSLPGQLLRSRVFPLLDVFSLARLTYMCRYLYRHVTEYAKEMATKRYGCEGGDLFFLMAEECHRLISRPGYTSRSFFGFFEGLVKFGREWKDLVRHTSLKLRNEYIKSGQQRPQVLKWLSLHIKGIIFKPPYDIVGLRFKEDSQHILAQDLDRLPEIVQWSNALYEVFPFDDDFARSCDQGYNARLFFMKAFIAARHRAYAGPLPSFDELLKSVYVAAPPDIVAEYPGRLISKLRVSGMLPACVSLPTALTRYIEHPVAAKKPLVFRGMHSHLVAILQSFFPYVSAQDLLTDLVLRFSSPNVKFQAKIVYSGCWLLSVCHPHLAYSLESHVVDADPEIQLLDAPPPRVTVSLDFSHCVADLLSMTKLEFFCKFPAIFAKERDKQLKNINIDMLMQFLSLANASRVEQNYKLG